MTAHQQYQSASLVEWLDDLTVRFLLNLPASELSSVPRLCFQVEEAQWFYEDFIRPAAAAAGGTPLPSLPLRQFCLLLFQHCPLLSGFTDAQHIAAYEEFLAYKVRVPVRGAILLDETMEKVLLVKGWKKGASWSFPRGKINKDEKDLDCAIREVYEETGYDCRAGGVVPENENEAKYIDITMREQHMRLFVFRDVPEDTYFEPRTRKEISKISWYAIKDLPGFRKQKAGQPVQEGDSSNASKFYMVAPFLGPLKKWIGAQRKSDLARSQRAAARTGNALQAETEEEVELETEQEVETQPAAEVAADKSEGLRRLLSIGQPAEPAPPKVPTKNHEQDLLALLQGVARAGNAGTIPRTPLEQVNTFAPQPASPQHYHPRHPSRVQQQGPPPDFPLSPQRVQQERQRHGSLHAPNVFGPAPNGFPGMPLMRPNDSLIHPGPPRFEQHGSMSGPVDGMPHPQQLPRFAGQPFQHHQMPAPFQQPPPEAYRAQGPQGPTASGPSVPSASALPPPRLNAQTAQLLDAFRSGVRQASEPPSSSGPRTQRPASSHQTALLGLLKRPSVMEAHAAAPVLEEMRDQSVSPTLMDVTEKPIRLERKPTLNEITRTLPAKLKVKSPPPAADTAALPAVSQANANTKQYGSSPSPRPRSSQPNVKPLPSGDSISIHKDLSKRHRPVQQVRTQQQPKAAVKPAGSPLPPVAILSRPGSSKGAAASTHEIPQHKDVPRSPFQPTVLKRPKPGDAGDSEPHKPTDKKEQLLALFGKAPATAPARPTPPPAEQTLPSKSVESENALLGLLQSTGTTPTQQITPTHVPPPAPRIEPERRPSSKTLERHQPPASRPPQQNLLLDLFNRNPTPSAITSPGSPISPFTLGTPGTTNGNSSLLSGKRDGLASPTADGRASRLSGVTSPRSGEGSGGQTPVEAREFLKGFLDGVAREGSGVK